ncbi:hypothetical protein KPH14_003208 [Odynerus spinipes]|uniref:Uncharacterized protein n=1 Tax=Odynerus spinipes TaxID=1348599 RepID=A0AAD9RYG6_9HYME|nr:hypothetical protein KPH14_003208 [Odynerus spinipes]
MTSLCDARDYYKKMLELQGKLRKSEEERIRLEERFNLLVQESRNRHDACISRLRMRYIEFLEEQRIRDERNHKLLGTLDRVDNSLSLMAAKTEKLNVLRKQYEVYLLQAYANRQHPGSITGDSGIVSQIDEGYSKKNSSVVQFNHRVNRNIPLSTVQFPTRVGDNSSKVEQMLHVQNLPGTRSSPLPATLHNKINISRRESTYESNPNLSKVIQNVNQRLQLSQTPSSQIYQPGQDIYNNGLISLVNLQANRNLQAQYLPTPSLENVTLSRSLLSQYNKLSTSHMEPIQSTTSLATNGVSTAENILRRNSSNIPQNHIAPTFSQHQSNIPITQHTLYHNIDIPQNIQRSNIRDITSLSALGSMPTKIVKVDTPRKALVEMSPRTQGQIDYSSTYKPLGHSFNGLKSKEISTHFLPRDNSPYHNVPNLANRKPMMEETMRGSSIIPRKKIDLDEETRTTRVLENELDRYIDKIRNLHRELDVQSLEEHDYEQNTSGDLLNITLSDDGMDYPPDKIKDERVPEEVAKVLALADDLASKKLSINEAELSRDNKDNDGNAEDKNTKSETRYDILSDQAGEASARLEKRTVNNNVAPFNPELEQFDKNNSNLEKQNWNRTAVKNIQHSNESKKTVAPENTDARNESSNAAIRDSKEHTKKDYILQKGEEVEISQEFFDVELLSPWDINYVAKEILEIQSDEITEDLVQNDEHNEIVSAAEDEHEKQIPETSTVLENEPENIILQQGDTVKEQVPNKGLEIPLDSEDFSEENRKEETIQNTSPNNDNPEYTDQHYENVTENAEVEETQENKYVEEDNQIADVQNTLEDDFIPDEQNVQELDQNNVYTSDINQEFVDPNQQYDYSQTALDENNEEYQNYANNDYAVTDETAIPTQGEYFDQQYEQYPVDSTQEYVQENQEYYDDKDGSNVYGENYETDQIHDNEANPEYLQEQYNTVEADQAAANIETDQNVDNIEADGVGDNLASNEIDKEPTNPNNDTTSHEQESLPMEQTNQSKKKKDVINSLLDSDTESTIERNVSNTESDFDFHDKIVDYYAAFVPASILFVVIKDKNYGGCSCDECCSGYEWSKRR